MSKVNKTNTLRYDMNELPYVKLSNGLVVANFSSPHDFEFEDGSTLPACSDERAEKFKVNFDETNVETVVNGVKIKNTSLDFSLSPTIRKEIDRVWKIKEFDIVLVALPQLIAMKEETHIKTIIDSPFRAIKMVSRTEKKVRIDQFCV